MGTLKLVLRGKLITPIVTKKTQFTLQGCKATIRYSKRRYYMKLNETRPIYPYSFITYLGTLVLEYKSKSVEKIKDKMAKLLQQTHMGHLSNEGLEQVQWLDGSIKHKPSKTVIKKPRKKRLRIRKGLPLELKEEQQELLKYALLHDFFHTNKHQSKIYQEPPLKDEKFVEKLRRHHDKTEEPLIKKFQYYDRLAASITRKIRSPIISRYNWQAKRKLQKIDFKKMAKEIKEVSEKNLWNLYRYIYKSKELGLLNESMNYGHTTIKNHLLIIANLIVQDFRQTKA
ncbi:MAG: hypothetical protein ACTSPG_01745 [Candidatus Hodarchaeales archaeon]